MDHEFNNLKVVKYLTFFNSSEIFQIFKKDLTRDPSLDLHYKCSFEGSNNFIRAKNVIGKYFFNAF